MHMTTHLRFVMDGGGDALAHVRWVIGMGDAPRAVAHVAAAEYLSHCPHRHWSHRSPKKPRGTATRAWPATFDRGRDTDRDTNPSCPALLVFLYTTVAVSPRVIARGRA